MAYTLTPTPFQTVVDSNGNPYSGALITTYLAGTSTLATTYTTSAGTANANPIVADGAGRFVAYLDPAVSYKFVYTTAASVAIKTVDNIAAVPSDIDLDVTAVAGETIALGEAVYLSGGDGGLTAGRWYRTDADNTYSSSAAKTVGIAPAAIASAATGTVRLQGRITGLSGLTAGTAYYASATAGALTSTAPANSRFIGTADGTTTLILTPSLAATPIGSIVTQASTATGAQADFALTTNVSTLVCTGAAPIFSGFAAGVAGQTVDIWFTGSTSLQILTQNAGSVAANRVICPSTVGLTVGTNGCIRISYDTSAARWHAATVAAGNAITRTFAGGNYTTNGAGGWTVASGDAVTDSYTQDNKLITVTERLTTTTVTAATGTELRVTIPGGFTSTKAVLATMSYGNNEPSGYFTATGTVRAAAGGTTLVCFKSDETSAWTASADQTQIAFVVTLEVD